jgi:hypothetical protein
MMIFFVSAWATFPAVQWANLQFGLARMAT